MSAPPMKSFEFETTEIDAAHEYLRAVYTDHTARLSGDRERFRFEARRVTEERFAVEYFSHSMELNTAIEPYRAVLVPYMIEGRFSMVQRRHEIRAGKGATFLLPPDDRMVLRWASPTMGLVRLDTEAVERFAEEVTGSPVTFRLAEPLSAERARYWQSVVRHVTRDFLGGPGADSPLLRTEVFRMLASALLETFPIAPDSGAVVGSVEAPVVRRATAFIEENARRDITVHDVAVAARIGVRALQAAFRQHLETTPMAYLRSARLRGAHLDLEAGHPSAGDTVGAVAASWGFGHHGRFAAAYRAEYGCVPQRTLSS